VRPRSPNLSGLMSSMGMDLLVIRNGIMKREDQVCREWVLFYDWINYYIH